MQIAAPYPDNKGVMSLKPILLYSIGSSESCRFAAHILETYGYSLTDHPSPEITHLLLDVPSFHANGSLPNGDALNEILRMLPESIAIIGGNLDQDYLTNYRKLDLLKDPLYLAKNAAITAECALRVATPYLHTTFADSPAMILGWGRIGKCLARLLSSLGCPVTVTARKESDRAMLKALGYESADFPDLSHQLTACKILFNTVPNPPIHSDILNSWKNGIAIDLASYPGLIGKNIIVARGLPGKYAPESSGKLIADTILRLWKEEIL